LPLLYMPEMHQARRLGEQRTKKRTSAKRLPLMNEWFLLANQ